jgi:hypothetical protein
VSRVDTNGAIVAGELGDHSNAPIETPRSVVISARPVAIEPSVIDNPALRRAARSLTERVAKLGDDYLRAHPYDEKAGEKFETDMRELAAGASNLLSLFDALAASMETPPRAEAKYKFGFLLRYVEAILDVAQITGVDPVRNLLRQAGKEGGLKGALKRQDKQKAWAAEALLEAKQFREKNPSASQDAVAEQIRVMLDERVPGHRQVKKIVARWEMHGQLPPRREP